MRQFVESKIARDREVTGRVEGLKQSLKFNQILAGHGKSERRVEQMRWQREADAREIELMRDHQFVQGEQQREQKAQLSKMEESIAKELEKRHAAEVRTEMNRRRICEGSDELKNLKLKLKAALMNKQRKVQFREKMERAVELQQFETDITAVMEVNRQAGLRAEETKEVLKHESRIQAKEVNLKQIDDRKYQREDEYQLFLKDKAMVQTVVDKIAREDEETEEKKSRSQRETREVLNQFRVEQEEIRQKQIALEQEELRKIDEYAEKKRQLEAAQMAEKARLEEEKKARLKKMLAVQEAQDKQSAELEYYRNELHQEELEALSIRREQMELRKKLEDRVEMHKAYEQQMRLKEEKRMAELAKEEEFRQVLLQKFASDDHIEQMNDQKRRLRVETHKREVTRLWMAKERLIAEERDKDNISLNYQREQDRLRQIIIEEERQRLLKEHATQLKEHLPKAVFETDEDHTMVMGREPDKS
eukprot:GEMP01011095.1.p1 GENE.GEMP01011095.1~~GEMP01011095.1.p1  ORF type:complete len:477 (+),score=157.11 GEMP01011095.1:158-1588(+)